MAGSYIYHRTESSKIYESTLTALYHLIFKFIDRYGIMMSRNCNLFSNFRIAWEQVEDVWFDRPLQTCAVTTLGCFSEAGREKTNGIPGYQAKILLAAPVIDYEVAG